jgi:hypothetical protein
MLDVCERLLFSFLFQEAFKYVQSCGNAFVPSYVPIVNKNKNKGMWKTTHALWSVTDGKVSKVLSIRFSHLLSVIFTRMQKFSFRFLAENFSPKNGFTVAGFVYFSDFFYFMIEDYYVTISHPTHWAQLLVISSVATASYFYGSILLRALKSD